MSAGPCGVAPPRPSDDWATIVNTEQNLALRVMHYTDSVAEERWAKFIADTLNKAEAAVQENSHHE